MNCHAKMAESISLQKKYELKDVFEVEEDSKPKIIGCGSYADVWELKFHGLKCAGKRFYENLCGVSTQIEEVLFKECQLLASLRHPNIVQFLGVYKSQNSTLPVLVMEYMHTTLSECINKWSYGILPEIIAYTILEDVALGLCYLHSMNIAHRDLSSNNVLLTADMHAKISDLGTAKILDITPKRKKTLTTAPGTLYYMPPESFGDSPMYTVEIDIFSYGVLAMEIFCGERPKPTKEFEEDTMSISSVGDSRFRRLTEIDRRQMYMDKISPKHPIKCLIRECLSESSKRMNAHGVKAYISQVKANVAAPCCSKLEMMQEQQCSKKKIEEQKNEILQLRNEASDSRSRISGLERELRVYKGEPSDDQLREELARTKSKLEKAEKDVVVMRKELLDRGSEYHERLHLLEKQRNDAMTALLLGEQLHLLHDNVTLHIQERRNPSESTQALENPAPMTATQCMFIGLTLYIGGGQNTSNCNVRNEIIAIDSKNISVAKLPGSPVIQFGLGNIGGRLLTIGGKSADENITDKIFEFRSGCWTESSIPALSKPRARICVISQTEDESSSSIVACGGVCIEGTRKVATNLVEVYRKDSRRWITVTPLPKSRAALRMTVLHNTVYLLGGYEDLTEESMPDCFSISKGNLFSNSQNIVWNTLPDVPSKSATPAHICSTLLAVGGITLINDTKSKRAIHAYNISLRKWVHIADLPMELTNATSATLSCGKVLIVGGRTTRSTLWEMNKHIFTMELMYNNFILR